MDREHNVRGLIKALKYPGQSEKAHQIRRDAAEYLAGYPYRRVVEALMDIMLSESDVAGMACDSICRLLYPHYQKKSEIISWWESNKDKPDELQIILKSNRISKRDHEWDEVRRKIDDSVKPSSHMEMLINKNIYGDRNEKEDIEIRSWIKEKDQKIAPELAKARAELEAKWRSEESMWEKEDASLQNWIP
jgi:hypothetical protein